MTQQGQVDPALLAQRPQPSSAPVSPHAIEWMLTVCAADAGFFTDVRRLLQASHFYEHEIMLRVTFAAMCHCQDNHGGVDHVALCHVVQNMISADPSVTLTPTQHDEMFSHHGDALLWSICHTQREIVTSNKQYAREVLHALANERTIVDPLRRVVNPGRQAGVPDVGELLDAINTQRARLQSTSQLPVVNMALEPGEMVKKADRFRLTGVPWVDEQLGGLRCGDVYGLIGPTGGGKTTTGIHVAASTAKTQWAVAVQARRVPPVSIFVTYEETAEKLRPRIWSNFFLIERAAADAAEFSDMSAPGQLKPYEREMQRDAAFPLSEQQRYMANYDQLRQCFVTLDCANSEEFPLAGSGGVPELASYIRAIAEQPRQFTLPDGQIVSSPRTEIALVTIDYAGLVVQMYADANNVKSSDVRPLLERFGDQLKKQISVPLDTTCLALHQTAGATGNRSASKPMKHTDAADAKQFAVNMSVCACLGVEDAKTGCRLLNYSKLRFGSKQSAPLTILQVDKRFVQMNDVTDKYVQHSTKGILPRNDVTRIEGAQAAAIATAPAIDDVTHEIDV